MESMEFTNSPAASSCYSTVSGYIKIKKSEVSRLVRQRFLLHGPVGTSTITPPLINGSLSVEDSSLSSQMPHG